MARLATVHCGICESPTVNGYVCSKCEVLLRELVIRAGITSEKNGDMVLCLLDELDVQISRQSRSATRFGGRDAEAPMFFDSRAAKAHATLSDLLTSWARHYGATGTSLGGPRRSARWLYAHIADITTSADAELLYGQLGKVAAHALRVIDRRESKTYVGMCSASTMQGPCQVDLYAPQDAPSLTCPQCGAVHDTEMRRRIMLISAQELALSAVDVVRMVSTYGGHVTDGQIYKWKHRGQLMQRGTTTDGRPMYRLGDVLQLAGGNVLHSLGLEG